MLPADLAGLVDGLLDDPAIDCGPITEEQPWLFDETATGEGPSAMGEGSPAPRTAG